MKFFYETFIDGAPHSLTLFVIYSRASRLYRLIHFRYSGTPETKTRLRSGTPSVHHHQDQAQNSPPPSARFVSKNALNAFFSGASNVPPCTATYLCSTLPMISVSHGQQEVKLSTRKRTWRASPRDPHRTHRPPYQAHIASAPPAPARAQPAIHARLMRAASQVRCPLLSGLPPAPHASWGGRWWWYRHWALPCVLRRKAVLRLMAMSESLCAR